MTSVTRIIGATPHRGFPVRWAGRNPAINVTETSFEDGYAEEDPSYTHGGFSFWLRGGEFYFISRFEIAKVAGSS